MSSTQLHKIRIGTRKSELALIQTAAVIDAIKKTESARFLEIEIVHISSLGDKVQDKPLPSIGGKGVFTEEIEEALSNFKIDIAVHSMKDLPTTIKQDLVIGCILPRCDRRDAVVFRSPSHQNIGLLAPNSVVGTSSLRRRAHIRRHFPHLIVKDVRGNLNTRLSKLDRDEKIYDVLILAAAGLKRMKLEDRIGQYLDDEPFYYAVGQGAIAVEMRRADQGLLEMMGPLNCRATVLECLAERVVLCRLKAGCSAPVGIRCVAVVKHISLAAVVMSLEGDEVVQDNAEITFGIEQGGSFDADPSFTSIAALADMDEMIKVQKMGYKLADTILEAGGANILAKIKEMSNFDI